MKDDDITNTNEINYKAQMRNLQMVLYSSMKNTHYIVYIMTDIAKTWRYIDLDGPINNYAYTKYCRNLK